MPEILPVIADGMARAPSRDCLALLVLRPPQATAPGDAAFSRIGRIFGAVYAVWSDEAADAAQVEWLRGTMGSAAPLRTGVYIGEADIDLAERQAAAHSPDVAARLAALRATWDPKGLFGAALQSARASAA